MTKLYAEKLKREQTTSLDKYANYFKIYLDKYLPKNKSAKILEVGCGIGNLMLAMKLLGYKDIEGFDIDESNIEVCKALNLNVKNFNIIEDKQKTKTKYDLIYAFDVIEHIPKQNTETFINKCIDLINSGGYLVLKTQNMHNPFNLYSRYKDFTHFVGFAEETFNQIMDELKVNNYDIFYGDGYVINDKSPLRVLIKFLFKLGLRILDTFLMTYLFFFLGGKLINVKREIFLVITK